MIDRLNKRTGGGDATGPFAHPESKTTHGYFEIYAT